jgi:dipeptidyl aminopeptidase/acylaminoacyl peptidase
MSADGGEERLLIGGKRSVSGLAFNPDGKSLTLRRRAETDPHNEIWQVSLDGMEVTKLTDTPHGVGSYSWRPDGGAIAYTVKDPSPAGRAKARAAGFRQIVKDEDYDHVSLWLWDRESGESKRLTEGVTVTSFEWAPDGKHLAAGIAPRNLVDDGYMFTRLHLVVPGENKVELLVENPGKLGGYAWSENGQTLAYLSAADVRDPHAGMLYSVQVGTGEARSMSEGLRGMYHQLEWTGNDSILAALSEGVASSLVTMDPASGEMRKLLEGSGLAFNSFVRGGDKIFAIASRADHGNEVYRLSPDGKHQRLTFSNPWLEEVKLGKQEARSFESVGGVKIEGLLIHPVGYQEGKRYPMVVLAHGGPEAHFSEGWNTNYSAPGQVLAGRGFFAWYPNYRASTGYGVEFAKMDHGDPMGAEFEDHIAAIAHFAKAGLVDPARVGVIGGSYGGYTAAWAATAKSQHFAAAVSFVPFVDIKTKWYTSDIPWEFYYVHYEEKWPHEQLEFLAERSPLSFAENCRTPLLLLGGTADPRVHPSQPHMLYRAVQMATKTPVRYVQYPGEGHGNRTNTNRYDYLLRGLRWLEYYLREGDHRMDPLPPLDLDYSDWYATDR